MCECSNGTQPRAGLHELRELTFSVWFRTVAVAVTTRLLLFSINILSTSTVTPIVNLLHTKPKGLYRIRLNVVVVVAAGAVVGDRGIEIEYPSNRDIHKGLGYHTTTVP
eukprot:scaffold2310_cov164-Amphora_coffeaeformis.AAC.18